MKDFNNMIKLFIQGAKMIKHKIISLFGAVSIIVCFTSCQSTGKFNIDAVRTLTGIQNGQYMAAYNGKDAAAVASLHAEDTVVLPPNLEMIKGREAIQNATTAEINAGGTDLALTTLDVYGSGDLAYEIGRYALKVKQDEQILMQDSGKYIVVWEQVSKDNWLIKVDIWNTDLPLK